MANCDKIEICPAYNTEGLLSTKYIIHHCKLRGEDTGTARLSCGVYQYILEYERSKEELKKYEKKSIKNVKFL